MYLHNILKHPKDHLIRKIYKTQNINPNKGDFVQLVKEDFNYIGMNLDEEEISTQCKNTYKRNIKTKLRENVFRDLKNIQRNHQKIKDITYNKFDMQMYMKTHTLKNQEVTLLFSLRSKK